MWDRRRSSRFSVLAINWLLLAGVSDSEENRYFYLISAAVFLAVSTGYFVAWKRAGRRPPPT